jgi:hypothetical protein
VGGPLPFVHRGPRDIFHRDAALRLARFIRRITVHCRSLDKAPSGASAADVCVSYSHAMSHSNGRADDAHLAHATRYRQLPTRGFANAPTGASSHAGGTVLGEW